MHRKYKQPYIGIVESKHIDHEALILEKRARMKILLIDPDQDLPIDAITEILKQSIAQYK